MYAPYKKPIQMSDIGCAWLTDMEEKQTLRTVGDSSGFLCDHCKYLSVS